MNLMNARRHNVKIIFDGEILQGFAITINELMDITTYR